MTRPTPSRLAAGLLGPASLFNERRRQKVGSAAAIAAACLEVIGEGIRPSIMNVVAAGRGFSESTLNRKRYKPILKAAQRRFEAIQADLWRPGDDDELSAMLNVLALGHWTEPTIAARTQSGNDESDGCAPDGDDFRDDDAVATGTDQKAEQLAADIVRLQASENRLRSELQRRDEQLYHALGVAAQRMQTTIRLRSRIRGLMGEIGSLTSEPWNARAPIDPDEDED